MRSLILKPDPSQQPLPVERIRAVCNYCGEEKDCFRGAQAPLSVKYREPKYGHGYVIKDETFPCIVDYIDSREAEYAVPLFGKAYRKVKAKDIKFGYVVKDYEFAKIVTGHEEKTESDHADICDDCVSQLAGMLPKKGQKLAAK